jgi:hypothetical protein
VYKIYNATKKKMRKKKARHAYIFARGVINRNEFSVICVPSSKNAKKKKKEEEEEEEKRAERVCVFVVFVWSGRTHIIFI